MPNLNSNKMRPNVFIGWSEEPSKLVARALHGWLPKLVKAVEPWMSAESIKPGRQWRTEIANALKSAKIGIMCLTPTNMNSAWMHFEAGAITIAIKRRDKFVCPYLIGVDAISSGTVLSDFQACHADKDGTLNLVLAINEALGGAESEDRLKADFNVFWSDLESEIDKAVQHGKPKPMVLTPAILRVPSAHRPVGLPIPRVSVKVIEHVQIEEHQVPDVTGFNSQAAVIVKVKVSITNETEYATAVQELSLVVTTAKKSYLGKYDEGFTRQIRGIKIQQRIESGFPIEQWVAFRVEDIFPIHEKQLIAGTFKISVKPGSGLTATAEGYHEDGPASSKN